LPDPPVFEKCEIFHYFLITKLINCERATLQGPSFKSKMIHARQQQIQMVVNEYKGNIGLGKGKK